MKCIDPIEDPILFEGLDDAIVGYSDVWVGNSKVYRAVYSGEKMVELFMNQGMTDEQAREWISFNVEGAYLGESTPVVFW